MLNYWIYFIDFMYYYLILMKSLLLKFFFIDNLDYTDSNSLFHISNGESTEWGIFRKNFDAHWFLWN